MKLGLCVGHDKIEQGAVNYLGESEYKFNKRIAYSVADTLNYNKIECSVYERNSVLSYTKQCEDIAKRMKADGITHSLHLHFNSYNEVVEGHECLIYDTESKKDNEFAEAFCRRMVEDYGSINRGVKEITAKHSGGTMLREVSNAGIICALIEPCFADWRNNTAVAIFEQEHRYGMFLVGCIIEMWCDEKVEEEPALDLVGHVNKLRDKIERIKEIINE